MERLSGLDAGFLYMETPSLHMHTLKVAVLDPAQVEGGYTFDRFVEVLAERLPQLPPFRRRLVEVPFGFHHPVWIVDPDFVLDGHLHRVVAPSPGGPRELDALISAIASEPLRRDRPLWEIHVVEGLAGGRFAAVAKIHHAAADGVAANALLANVMAPTGSAGESPQRADLASPESIPTSGRLLLDALADHARGLSRLPALVGRTVRSVVRMGRGRRRLAVRPPVPIRDTVSTRFNRALTPRRDYASISLSLEDVKDLKRRAGVTVNDVVLTIVGGALRAHLDARGETPAKPLVAGIPVSTDRPDADVRLSGNRTSNFFTSLRTDLADPVERLAAVHDVTSSAKELQNLLGAELFQDWVEYTPPRPYGWFMRTYSARRLAERHAPPINLVVSNVPGPREQLRLAGSVLEEMYSVGPILEGIGLNITCWSYGDQLNFAILACADHDADAGALAAGLAEALAELDRAVGGSR